MLSRLPADMHLGQGMRGSTMHQSACRSDSEEVRRDTDLLFSELVVICTAHQLTTCWPAKTMW